MRAHARLALALVAGCGDDGDRLPLDAKPPVDQQRLVDGANVDPDAAVIADAPADQKVILVACPADVDATITTNDNTFAFVPETATIPANGIVRFVTSASHSIIPSPNMPSDPGLQVGFNANVCLQFTVTGPFNFLCNPHRFVGTVTVN